MALGSLVRPPSGVRTAWMVRRPVSSRKRLTYRRDLYGVSFLPFIRVPGLQPLCAGRAIPGAVGGSW